MVITMARYDYICASEHVYTEERSIHDDQIVTVCPVEGCGLILTRVWSAVPAVYKGKGFYSTDKHDLLKPGQQVDY